MDAQISWHVELAVKPGQLERLRVLTGEMVEATRREPGALSYQRFVSADGAAVELYERYADSAAALAHLQNFTARFALRFGGMVERKRFSVFGHPSDALKQLLDGFGATYLAPFGDFPYW